MKRKPISQADAFHQLEQEKEDREAAEVALSERLIAEVIAEEKVVAINAIGLPTRETLPEPQYTPEKVREMFTLIARKRKNMEEMRALLAELEHTLAVRVGTEHVLYHPRHHTGAKTQTCQRCGKRMGVGINERAVEFDGRWWHMYNCERKS